MKNGNCINYQDPATGNSSLHCAVIYKHTDYTLRNLLGCGAKTYTRNRSGLTPLDIACRGNFNESTPYFDHALQMTHIEGHDHDPKLPNVRRQNAARQGSKNSLHHLMQNPTTSAIVNNEYFAELVKNLIAAGHLPGAQDEDGKTPIDYAQANNQSVHAALTAVLAEPEWFNNNNQ
jgi:ankyrin repeat protein